MRILTYNYCPILIHGNPGGGRLGSYNPSPEDKNFAYEVSILFIKQNTKPKFYVWRFGTKTQYDSNGVVDKER